MSSNPTRFWSLGTCHSLLFCSFIGQILNQFIIRNNNRLIDHEKNNQLLCEQHEVILCFSGSHSLAASGSGGLYPLSASLQFHIVLISASVCLCVCVCVCAAFIGMCPLTTVIKFVLYFKLCEPIKSVCSSQNPWKQIKNSNIEEICCCLQLGAVPTQAVGKCCLSECDWSDVGFLMALEWSMGSPACLAEKHTNMWIHTYTHARVHAHT